MSSAELASYYKGFQSLDSSPNASYREETFGSNCSLQIMRCGILVLLDSGYGLPFPC